MSRTPVPASADGLAVLFDRINGLFGNLSTKAELDHINQTVTALASDFHNLNVPGMWSIMLASFQTMTDLLNGTLKGQENIMSAITDWAAQEQADLTAVKASLDNITTGVTTVTTGIANLDALITSLGAQLANGGTLTAADQIALDAVKSASAGLVTNASEVATAVAAISTAPPA